MTLAGLPIDEREMILDLLAKVRSRMLTKERILELDEKEEFPEEVIRELLGPNIGLQLLFIPEEYGGLGGGARDIAVVSEEMAKICLGISTAFLAIHLGTDPILVGATEEQKEKWLTRIAEGETIVAYAVTEPEAGSNLSRFKTTATPITDESGKVVSYRITGNKQFISNGGYADLMTVLAQTPEGPSFFVVEKGMEGLMPGKPEVKHGIRCANTAPIVFDNVIVPAENLIGLKPGQGLKQANEVFGYTRLMVATFGLGAGVAALEKAVEYAKQRVQFGSILMKKQGYTHTLIIPNLVRLEAARAYIEETATRLDSGEKDLQVEGSIAKLYATEAGNKAADDAIQAFGGYGYICEYEVEKIKRDVKITTIYEGTTQIQQMIIGTFRWRNTIKSKGEYYAKRAAEMDEIHKDIPDIKADVLARATRALNAAIFAVHKSKLTRQQFIMFELADLMAQVEVGNALMRKIRSKSSSDKDYDRLKTIARIFSAGMMMDTHQKLNHILFGTGKWTNDEIQTFQSEWNLDIGDSQAGLVRDMDKLVDYLMDE